MNKNNINGMIDRLLKEHIGGEIFFDNLDESVRNNSHNILDLMCERVEDMIRKLDTDIVIVSGSFGRVFSTYVSEHFGRYPWNMIPIVCVEGGLRKGNRVMNFGELLECPDGNYLFVDDSFYSGKTRDVISEKINEYDGTLVKTMVFYDGSINKDDTVESFYRYHDVKSR